MFNQSITSMEGFRINIAMFGITMWLDAQKKAPSPTYRKK
jgi:hypothetical protein